MNERTQPIDLTPLAGLTRRDRLAAPRRDAGQPPATRPTTPAPRWWSPLLAAASLGLLVVDLASTGVGAAGLNVPLATCLLLLMLATWRRNPGTQGNDANVTPATAPLAGKVAIEPAAPAWPAQLLAATVDTRLHCADVSPALAQLFGLSRADLRGEPIADHFGPLNGPAVAAALRAAADGTAQTLRVSLLRPGQARRWLQLAIVRQDPATTASGKTAAPTRLAESTPLPSGPLASGAAAAPGLVVVAVDVTDLQSALETAQRGERRLSIIMDQIPVTVSYIDAENHYRYINRAQEQWLGKTSAEVVGYSVPALVGERVWADVEPRLSLALQGQHVPLERHRIDRNGNSVWHSGRHVPDISDDGKVVGEIGRASCREECVP